MKNHLFAAVAAVLVLSSCGQKASVKVMSFNIRHAIAQDGENAWEYRCEADALMLQQEKPDCFGVQEAFDFQRDYLLEKLPTYRAIGVGRTDGLDGDEHVCVFWNTETLEMRDSGNFWLSETPEVPSKGWDGKYPRLATWALLHDKANDKDFFVVNTHLDHKGVQARREGVNLIISRIGSINPDSYPMVIMGDFNILDGQPEIEYFNGVMSNARNVALKSDRLPSFNGWGKPEKEKIIDYIYFNGFSACREFKTVVGEWQGRTLLSDHNPMYAVLEY